MVVFYDDRTGGSAGGLVNQDMLTLENNKINRDKLFDHRHPYKSPIND